MAKISIIIPVYNAEKYINATLDSILNQTFKDIEVILVNDGSLDNSLSICKKYAEGDSRIIVLNKKNEGVSIARNTGIKSSSGEYILFIDADDWIEPDMCEILYNNITKYDGDICFCNHIKEFDNKSEKIAFNAKGHIIEKDSIKKEIILQLIEEEDINLKHSRESFRSPWGKLFKSSIIKNNKIIFNKDLVIGEDFIFDIEYLKYAKKAVMAEEFLYHYRISNESTLGRYKKEPWAVYKKLLINLQCYLKDNFKEEEYFYRLNKLKLKYFLICIDNEMSILNPKTIWEKRKYISSICEDEILTYTIENYSKNGSQNKMKLFFLRKKMYFFIIIYSELKNICKKLLKKS